MVIWSAGVCQQMFKQKAHRKYYFLALVVIACCILLWQLPLLAWSDACDVWIADHYVAGVFLYIGALLIWSLLVPTAVPILLAGYFFGFWLGTAATYVATTLSFMLAFFVTRTLLFNQVEAYLSTRPKRKAFIDHLERAGWRLVFWMRMSPIIPFHVQNYCYGASKIPFSHCLWATWMGKAPGVMATVLLGSVIKQSSVGLRGMDEVGRPWWWYVFLSFACLAAVIVCVIMVRAARHALRNEHVLEEDESTD